MILGWTAVHTQKTKVAVQLKVILKVPRSVGSGLYVTSAKMILPASDVVFEVGAERTWVTASARSKKVVALLISAAAFAIGRE